MKKLGSIAVAFSMMAGTVAPQLGAVASAAAAPTAVAALGVGAMLTPSTAHAQSGSRVCAMRFGGRDLLMFMYMEVSKSDFVTCPATVAAFEFMMTTSSLGSWIGTGISYQLFGGLRYNQVCEKFTEGLRWYNGDICNETQRYKIYAVINYNGNRAIKKLT